MFLMFILFLVACIVFAGIAFINKDGGDDTKGLIVGSVISGIVAVVFLIISFTYVIQPGFLGIEILFGKVMGYSESGLHAKNPLASIIRFDSRTIKEEYLSEAGSQDLQEVNIKVVINYRLNYKEIGKLYSEIGKDFSSKVIEPAVQETVKASASKFKVEEIITKRIDLKEMIESNLKERLARYFIVLETVNLQDIQFSPEFSKVVEEKQIEEQRIKTAEYRKQQAEQDKQKTILDAQAEAEKQRLLKVNTSKEVIELKWIEKWDGKLPVTMLGEESVPMVNLNK